MGTAVPQEMKEDLTSVNSHEANMAHSSVTMLVTVDVEADDEWQFTSAAPRYQGITALPRLQRLCDRYGVRPTYLVTFDAASDRESARILNELAGEDRCEIGAHMHPWRTPPLYPELDCATGYRPYLYDYPKEFQAQKMANLTNCLEDVFQRPITSHRAGRWGIDSYGCDLLEQNGYLVDTSVAPLRSLRRNTGYPGGAAGPHFLHAPREPYHPSHTEITVAGTRTLLEIPLSVGVVGAALRGRWQADWVRMLGRGGLPGETALRVLKRIGAAWVVSLNPVRHEEMHLRALIEVLRAENASVLNMAFHSSELIPGESPCVATEDDVSRVWHGIEAVLRGVASYRDVSSTGLTAAAVALMQPEKRSPRFCSQPENRSLVKSGGVRK